MRSAAGASVLATVVRLFIDNLEPFDTSEEEEKEWGPTPL
jgi:hypothetical protein